MRDHQRRGDILRRLHPPKPKVERRRIVRGPSLRQWPVFIIRPDNRPPDRPAVIHLNWSSAFNRDGFMPHLDARHRLEVGRPINFRRNARLYHHQVARVRITIRKTPSDAAIATRHHKRNSRQGYADHATLDRALAPLQRGAKPDIRQAEPEVHVIRQHRRTVSRARTRERKSV